ncbi:MAG TPA: circadian clock KaiB family protein [Acidimicrobiales bacterium]|nr:circadian clock KaiB family protein [Acidimicrobiales bacterium]
MTAYRFRLYVLGETARTETAVQQLRALCASRGCAPCDIEVVDVHAHPEVADEARIVATPTLDRIAPAPLVRVIGDLASDQLAMALELPPPRPQTSAGG